MPVVYQGSFRSHHARQPLSITDDIVIGAASGYGFEQIKYWLNSLECSGFAGKRIVLTGNAESTLVEELRRRHCEVVTAEALTGSRPEPFVDEEMSVERFFLIWKYLSTLRDSDVRFVIAVDMRDAVFQTNPSDWLERNLGSKRLVVASEGLRCEHEPWNHRTMLAAFGPKVLEYMRDRRVWNSGTIAGEMALLRDLTLNLYLCTPRHMTYADQASLNVLLSLEPYRSVTLFDRGDLGWACEAATMVASARGADLSYKFLGDEPLFDGDRAHTARGTPYCIVHQYDRIPAWKACFERKFG